MTEINNGIGFLGLLGLLFIALKLTNFIDWSWWLVLAPLWIPIAIVLFMLIIVAIVTYFNVTFG